MSLFGALFDALPSASVILVFLLVLLLSTWFLTRPRNLPPGPCPYPIIGNFLDVMNSASYPFHLKLVEYKRRYGNIFRLYFGFHPVIVLNHPDVIREALVEKAEFFSGRPNWFHMANKLSKNAGIVNNIHGWPATRRFAMSSMRDFGVGKSTIEQRIIDEAEVLTAEFMKYDGKPFVCQLLMSNAVSNIICGVVFNKRFEYDDEDFKKVVGILNTFVKANPYFSIPNVYPYVGDIAMALFKGQVQQVKSYMQVIWDFIEVNVEQHKETYDPDNIRDFTDIYIASTRGEGEESKVSKDDAFRIIFDMFGAGTETTSTTLQWLFIYLMFNQTVQDKCRKEIYEVLGTSRRPANSDRGSLIYTEATLLEVQRITPVVPLSLPHTASRDMTVAGYNVPKDAFVIPNIYACHRDYDLWGDPDSFRPERWIDEDGKLKTYPGFLPFNVGKRACAGESLAKLEIFLFAVTLIQRFRFKLADKMPSVQTSFGATLVPDPYEMIAEPLS